MAKIVLAFTRPSKEYSQPVADALIRDLDGLVQKIKFYFSTRVKRRNTKINLV
jgi:hypothetical protein